jgi:hypothetical protein
LKIHFTRSANIFATTDTTKEPGFASAFHEILTIMAAKAWVKIFKPDLYTALLSEEDRMLKDIDAFYSRRAKDERAALIPAAQNNR